MMHGPINIRFTVECCLHLQLYGVCCHKISLAGCRSFCFWQRSNVEFEFPDSSECKDTGVISVVKYKPLFFLLHVLCWLGFSVDWGDALFRSLHCIDTKGRWLTVVTGYRKDALGFDSRQGQEFRSSLSSCLLYR